jgi:hypothetical protein
MPADWNYDSSISRVTAIKNLSRTSLPDYADHTFLGAGTILQTTHPGVTNGLTLSRGSSSNYSGWDQWGQLADQVWQNGGVTVDEYKCDYDLAGNRLWKQNATPSASSLGLDEIYSYDALYRLVATGRGTLNSNKTAVTGTSSIPLSQTWTLDGVVNWTQSTTNSATQEVERRQLDASPFRPPKGYLAPPSARRATIRSATASTIPFWGHSRHVIRLDMRREM